MISNIRQIRGIGRFKNFTPDPPIELGKVTVVYGENGKGKSSLAILLRSLKDGGELRLGDRKTIGVDKQNTVMTLDDGATLGYSFPGNGWSGNDLDVLVFDEIFIGENVYEGTTVSKDHKRSLPRLILGKDEIDLVVEEQKVKRSIESRNVNVRHLRDKITQRIGRRDDSLGDPPDIEKFLALQPILNIEERVKDQARLVGQLKRSNRYLDGEMFKHLVLPDLPIEKLTALLESTIEDIESNAFERVQGHLVCFVHSDLEGWIEHGTEFASSDEICPFCGQPLEGSSLVRLYQDYFSEEYKQLLSDVRNFATEHLTFDSIMDAINSSVASNQQLVDFWAEELDDLHSPTIEFEPIRLILTSIRHDVGELLGLKGNKPLEPFPISELLKVHLAEWDSIHNSVEKYNAQHSSNNLAITSHKATLSSSDLDEAQRELVRLNNVKLRFSEELTELCEQYLTESDKLDEENRDKDSLQARIKEVNECIDVTYVSGLNRYLERLHADFRISKVKLRPDGTGWQVDYCIVLMGADIPVGGNTKLKSGQSYKSVLSEGDRRTLALALFLATLDRNANLDEAIIVYDDPVTSMDDNRSSATADLILEICEKASQVLVLSHRKRFLRNFWIKYKRSPKRYGELRLLEVCPRESDTDFSDIRPNWDIKTATETDFDEHVRYVVEYIRNSPKADKRNAAPKLRLAFENHYKSLYQDEFTDDSKPFGHFIDKVLTCSVSSSLYPLKTNDGLELKRLNEATSTFHHPNSLDLEETELRQLCKETLNLIGRRY